MVDGDGGVSSELSDPFLKQQSLLTKTMMEIPQALVRGETGSVSVRGSVMRSASWKVSVGGMNEGNISLVKTAAQAPTLSVVIESLR